jgi:iron complex transport system substrate-binding protein
MRTSLTGKILACLLLLVPIFATSAGAETLSITHASGTTEVSRQPAKVVILDLAALDLADSLGIPVAGVPTWRMPPDLVRYEAASYAKTGSLFEPDYEAIHALKPDLIVVGARMREKYARLAQIAPTIDLSTDPKDFYASVARNARLFGELFGKQTEVEQRIRQLERSTAALQARGKRAGRALIVLTTGGKITAYGKGSRFGALHEQFGLQTADPALKPAIHGQIISHEYLLKTNPDWLFVIDRDAAIGAAQGKSARQLLDNPLVAQTRAWKQDQVVYLDPARQYLTSGSLRTEQAIVDEIDSALARKR